MRGLSKIRKLFINLLWVTLTAFLVIVILAFFLAGKYEKELEQFSISRINQVVDTKISVNDIDVSFIRTFPYFSVIFNDVIVWSSHNFNREEFVNLNTDTLFTANNLYLQFNPVDLLRSKIRIRRIYSVKGSLNILVDSKGLGNYKILKSKLKANDDKSKKDRTFELDALRIADLRINLDNRAKNTFSRTRIDNLLLKGKFSKNEFSIGTQAGFKINNFTRNDLRYANDYEVSLRLILQVKDSLANIQKGELSINTIRMNAEGNILFAENADFNLNLESRNINISTLISSFPLEWKEKIPVNAQGRGDLAIKVKGPYSATKMPSINAVYVLSLEEINFNKLSLRNLNLKGNYSNGKNQNPGSTKIEVEKFRLRDRNSDLEGKLLLQNLENPLIEIQMNGEADAASISDLIFADRKISLNGFLSPNLILRTRVNSLRNFKTENLYSAGLSGVLGLKKVEVQSSEIDEKTVFDGTIRFAGESWYPDLILTRDKNKFEVKAQMDYVMKYLTDKNQVLWVTAVVKGDNIDITPYLRKNDKKNGDQEKKTFKLPSYIAGNIKLELNKFKTKNFMAENLHGDLRIRPGRIDLYRTTFRTMNGDVNTDISALQTASGKLFLKTNNRLNNVNLQELFYTFQNFGQDNLRAEHIKGSITGNIDFNSVFDSTLSIMKDRIYAEANIKINSGELIGFEPLEKLSVFIDIEELKHMKFSTINNTVFISNGEMTIPEMDINSNAFNITVSGKHDFNGDFSYKLKILLSEILTGKARKRNEEFYVMEDNRKASIYLSIDGKANDYNIKYDKKEAVAAIKEDLKKEKTTLKTILNEEFGWFKKDSTNSNLDTTDPEFILEWEETDTTGIKSENRPLNRKEKKNKRIKQKKEDEETFELEWEENDGK